MIKNKNEWVDALKDVALRPESPVKQKDGKWEVVDRKDTWKKIASRITDPQLAKLKAVAVEVLTERDPQFDLDPNERYAAAIHDKVLKHSRSLRKGLAETLALLGSDPSPLTMATLGRPQATAALTVREILSDADWLLWASLSDCLPILAEAAPSEFLDAVESALKKSPPPFVQVFAQESSGFAGRTYMTGLLWGLESLAWSPDYLTQVTVILGDLAALDPGGNWANRPANSLIAIFLPWHPQTTADTPKRKAAVTALLREQPKVGWPLLLALLPKSHSTTSGTHKPSWRELIPKNWSDKVLNKDYLEQVQTYSEMAIDLAATSPAWIVELIEHLPDLPTPNNAKFLDLLRSEKVTKLADKERLPVWEALISLITEHRRFSDADWAMTPEALEKIDQVAKGLAPKAPELTARRLFSSRDWDLHERTEDHAEQEKVLSKKRHGAAKAVFDAGGVDAIVSLSKEVESPWQLGRTFGEIALDDVDNTLLPANFLSNDQHLKDLAGGYTIGRFTVRQWAWIDEQLAKGWTASEKAALLVTLPFEKEAWQRAEETLGADEALYWKNAGVFRSSAKEDLLEAVDKLLLHKRPRAALECLTRLRFYKIAFPPELAVRALMEGPGSSEPRSSMDPHSTQELIKWLQENPPKDEKALFKVEWNYLPVLGSHHSAKPKTLMQMIADRPAFYCEVIQACYRSEKVDAKDYKPTEEQRNIAQNAIRLLHEWTLVPGVRPDGSFDAAAFTAWLAEVKRICEPSGHLPIGLHHVGQVLSYAPADPGGLWIPKAVAEALNERDSDELRAGFTNKLFNRRGVHGYDGGKAELDLAAKYHKRAEALDALGFQRIAAAVRDFAKSYEQDAEREAKRDPFKD